MGNPEIGDEPTPSLPDNGSGATGCEVISIVSGKGGTGKTFVTASLAYSLQNAGHRVCLIDTDMATQGLSLFILGSAADRGTSNLKKKHSIYHMVQDWTDDDSGELPVPKAADPSEGHETSYNLIVSNKQFYDRRLSLGVKNEEKEALDLLNESMAELSDLFRAKFQLLMNRLLDQLRNSGNYEYILVDTRGGFGEISLIPAVYSDSILVIVEPDSTSFHQSAKLLANIDLMSLQEQRTPVIRGFLVNKAVDGDEMAFRSLLSLQFDIDVGLSWPLPLDTDVIPVYKEKQIPYKAAPAAAYSSASLEAFTDIFDLVTAEWPKSYKDNWHNLRNAVKEARAAQEQARARADREAQQRELEAENEIRDYRLRAEEAMRRLEFEKATTSAGRRTLIVAMAGVIIIVILVAAFLLITAQNQISELETRLTALQESYDALQVQNLTVEEELETLRNELKDLQAEYQALLEKTTVPEQ